MKFKFVLIAISVGLLLFAQTTAGSDEDTIQQNLTQLNENQIFEHIDRHRELRRGGGGGRGGGFRGGGSRGGGGGRTSRGAFTSTRSRGYLSYRNRILIGGTGGRTY